MRWYILDSFNFIDIDQGQAQAERSITRADGFFEGHYPLYPVLPGTILIEMIAQAGGVLVGASLSFQKEIILGKINWARFHAGVVPPALLTIDVCIREQGDDGARVEGAVSRQGDLLGEASILLVQMGQLGSPALDSFRHPPGPAQGRPDMPGNGESIVFTQDFMDSFGIPEMLKNTKTNRAPKPKNPVQ